MKKMERRAVLGIMLTVLLTVSLVGLTFNVGIVRAQAGVGISKSAEQFGPDGIRYTIVVENTGEPGFDMDTFTVSDVQDKRLGISNVIVDFPPSVEPIGFGYVGNETHNIFSVDFVGTEPFSGLHPGESVNITIEKVIPCELCGNLVFENVAKVNSTVPHWTPVEDEVSNVIAVYKPCDYPPLPPEPNPIQSIVYSANRTPHLGDWEIHIIDENGAIDSRLTYNETTVDEHPVFTHAGTYAHNYTDIKVVWSRDHNIWIMNVIWNGSAWINTGETQLTFTGLDNHPYVDIDNKIYFNRKAPNGTELIMRMNLDGSNITQLTNDNLSRVHPIALFGMLVYAVDLAPFDNIGDYVATLNTTSGVETMIYSPSGSVSGPSWKPDGSKIVLSEDQDGDGKYGIRTIFSNGTLDMILTDGTYDDLTPYYKWPTGNRIAFVRNLTTPQGNKEIFRMNSDGTNQFNVTNNEYPDTFVVEQAVCNPNPPAPPAGGDVAVTNVVPAENQVYPTWTVPINITVTVLNNGTSPASFTVTAYYGDLPTPEQWEAFWSMGDVNKDGYINETDSDLILAAFGTTDPDADLNQDGIVDLYDWYIWSGNYGLDIWTHFNLYQSIGTQIVVNLPSGTSTTLTFTWDLSGVPLGLYTIKANATLTDDTNPDNNEYIDDTVKVKMVGDITGDADVDGEDYFFFAGSYGANLGEVGYSLDADLNADGNVDGEDYWLFAGNYGLSTNAYPPDP